MMKERAPLLEHVVGVCPETRVVVRRQACAAKFAKEIGIELEVVELLFARSRRLRRSEIYFRARAVGIPEPRSFTN